MLLSGGWQWGVCGVLCVLFVSPLDVGVVVVGDCCGLLGRCDFLWRGSWSCGGCAVDLYMLWGELLAWG